MSWVTRQYRRFMMRCGVKPCRLVTLSLRSSRDEPFEWEAVVVPRWWATEEDVSVCKSEVAYLVLKVVREFTGNRDIKLGRVRER